MSSWPRVEVVSLRATDNEVTLSDCCCLVAGIQARQRRGTLFFFRLADFKGEVKEGFDSHCCPFISGLADFERHPARKEIEQFCHRHAGGWSNKTTATYIYIYIYTVYTYDRDIPTIRVLVSFLFLGDV